MSKPTKPTTVCFYFEVTLAGDEAVNTFCQLEVLMCQWRHVVKLLDEDGPFIYSLTRTKRATSRRYPDACAQCHLAKVDHAASVSWRRLTSLIVAGPGWRVPWSPGRLTR